MAIGVNDIKIYYSGGVSNSSPNLSIGGNRSNHEIVGGINNLFQNITIEQSEEGHTDYRCIYIYNDSDNDPLYDAEVFIESDVQGGGNVQLGLTTQNDQQQITIVGDPTGGFIMEYDGYLASEELTIPFVSETNSWATAIESILNTQSAQMSGVVVTGYRSATTNTRVFTITFDGEDRHRLQNEFGIRTAAPLPFGVSITLTKLQHGSPINIIATSIDQSTVTPVNVLFSDALNTTTSPSLDIGTLRTGEWFPLWIKRSIVSGTEALAGDGFTLRLTGNPLNSG